MPRVSKETAVWFDYPDDPCGGRVEIRHLKETKVQRIMGECVDSKVIDRGKSQAGKRQVETEIKVDNVRTNELLAEACVKNWENFQDENGKDLPCNPKNIRLFAGEDGFIKNLVKWREELAEMVAEQEAGALKN